MRKFPRAISSAEDLGRGPGWRPGSWLGKRFLPRGGRALFNDQTLHLPAGIGELTSQPARTRPPGKVHGGDANESVFLGGGFSPNPRPDKPFQEEEA